MLKIESTIELDKLVLQDKKWTGKFVIGTIIPKSYYRYKVILELDEKPYLDRIHELEKGLDDSLFREERASRKELNKNIGKIRDELNRMRRDCESIEFTAMVDSLVYKDRETVLTLRVPDDVIEPINKQKFRLEAYKIILIPVFLPEPTM